MFSVFHSNQLESLKILLVHLIKAEPLSHPFISEKILVQSPGMSQWLKMELAKEFGVAGNLEFPLPATFIWDMFTHVLPDVPKRSAFNKEAMSWKLVSLIPSLLDNDEFAPLKHYLEHDTSSLKLFQLAEKIADIFDGYLVYRPDWIELWEQNIEVKELDGQHPWQPILWRALYQFTEDLGQSLYHRGNLYKCFIEGLSRGDVDVSGLPQRLFIFGITALPPRYLDALKALGEHLDIYLMFSNPCQDYWGEIRDKKYLSSLRRKQLAFQGETLSIQDEVAVFKGDVEPSEGLHIDSVTGNTLLASMGKLGRDNLYLLSQLELEEHEYFSDIVGDGILQHIQSDILYLKEQQNDQLLSSSQHKHRISRDDNSLSLHSCHSAMREVEVLHDSLLHWFDDDPTLCARDIIVMVADINAYSAAIQAVFGNAPGDRYIPFSISDRTTDHESPILNAFLHLLELPQSRCLATELLELLETPAILTRFDISQEDYEIARRWVDQTGIRWGLNRDISTELDFPINEQNTWQSGISRLLAGYMMSESVELLTLGNENYSPFKEVQGIGAELAGKLAHYIETISIYREQLGNVHTVQEWRSLLSQLLDSFFCVEIEDEVALSTVRDSLAHLQEQLDDAHYQQVLDADVVRYYLQSKLSTTRVSQRFLAGQVNFCTLMPMRSIPFKVVCLLGMNDGTYPRSNPSEGFDLINGRGRIGDRSRRDDERYLFLEATLSAKQRLYISYIGQSIKDKSERLPSIFVTELLEYCQHNYCLEGDEELDSDESGQCLSKHLTTYHSMVPYSPLSFQGALASYAQEWFPVAQGERRELADSSLELLHDCLVEWERPIHVDLVELQKFWALPVKYFFNRRLKVAFETQNIVVEDQEPFAFDHLQSYLLREQLVEKLLVCDEVNDQQELEAFKQIKRAQGILPMGAFGDLEFSQHIAQATPLARTILPLIQNSVADVEVNIALSVSDTIDVQLLGWLTNIYTTGMVRYRTGRVRSQDYLRAWIDHLAMLVSGYHLNTHLVGYDKKVGVEHWILQPLNNVEQAKEQLELLVRFYFQGLNQPLAYFPNSALSAIDAGLEKGQWVENREVMEKKLTDTFSGGYQRKGEVENDYIRRVWPEMNTKLAQELIELACDVLKPARMAAIDATSSENINAP